MSDVAGVVYGDGKPYTIYFDQKLIKAKQKKYRDKGAVLKVGGQTALTPAPLSLKEKRNRSADEHLKHGPVSGSKSTRGGRVETCFRAVVNLTTGQYFSCASDAAFAISVAPSNLAPVLKGTLKHIKQNRFRYATPEEIAAKRVLP